MLNKISKFKDVMNVYNSIINNYLKYEDRIIKIKCED